VCTANTQIHKISISYFTMHEWFERTVPDLQSFSGQRLKCKERDTCTSLSVKQTYTIACWVCQSWHQSAFKPSTWSRDQKRQKVPETRAILKKPAAWPKAPHQYTTGRPGPSLVGLMSSGVWSDTARNKNGPCHAGPSGLRWSSGMTQSPLSGLCWVGGLTSPTVSGRSKARINFHIFIFYINFMFLIKNLFNIIKFKLKYIISH
jgi:hypothetical protein